MSFIEIATSVLLIWIASGFFNLTVYIGETSRPSADWVSYFEGDPANSKNWRDACLWSFLLGGVMALGLLVLTILDVCKRIRPWYRRMRGMSYDK